MAVASPTPAGAPPAAAARLIGSIGNPPSALVRERDAGHAMAAYIAVFSSQGGLRDSSTTEGIKERLDGAARRRPARGVPYGLDVVPMEVVHEGSVIPLRVLGPDAGLAPVVAPFARAASKNASTATRPSASNATCAAVVTGSPRQIVKSSRPSAPVRDTVFLHVQLLIAEWSHGW
jgi:hypothetical protein